METKDYFTLTIACYGAILSTVVAVRSFLDKRSRIKVKLSNGFLTGQPGEISDVQLLIDAINVGSIPVTLSIYCLKLPDSKKVYPPGFNTPIPLPCELAPGKKYHGWYDMKVLAIGLRNMGYSGNVRLIGEFTDQTDRKFTSNPWTLDIAEWTKS